MRRKEEGRGGRRRNERKKETAAAAMMISFSCSLSPVNLLFQIKLTDRGDGRDDLSVFEARELEGKCVDREEEGERW